VSDLFEHITKTAIEPALALLPSVMDTPSARVLLLTFGMQESRFEHRDQLEKGGKNTTLGPALSFWQFERAGGVLGVLQHKASRGHAGRICTARGVNAESRAVWERMAFDDVLGAAFARLLIYTDPLELPMPTDAESAWRLYLRTWRPGAHERGSDEQRRELRSKFQRNHNAAVAFVKP
jgi:hypothetical protein